MRATNARAWRRVRLLDGRRKAKDVRRAWHGFGCAHHKCCAPTEKWGAERGKPRGSRAGASSRTPHKKRRGPRRPPIKQGGRYEGKGERQVTRGFLSQHNPFDEVCEVAVLSGRRILTESGSRLRRANVIQCARGFHTFVSIAVGKKILQRGYSRVADLY